MRIEPIVVPIPGSKNRGRVLENLGAADVALSADELTELEHGLSTCEVHGRHGCVKHIEEQRREWESRCVSGLGTVPKPDTSRGARDAGLNRARCATMVRQAGNSGQAARQAGPAAACRCANTGGCHGAVQRDIWPGKRSVLQR